MKIAILIPCYNEELTVKNVINDFQHKLPDASIYVFDNNSTDKTAAIAEEAGAIVKREPRQGKGFVVEAMFRTIDADYYVMVDGDDTYPVDKVELMLSELKNSVDMVVGDRLSNGTYSKENTRVFHSFGNWLVKTMINRLFHVHLNDIMSGYRVFSKDFVKNYPALCDGFQVETDMTIFALDHNYVIKEIEISFQERPDGSESKINTYTDGARVIMTIFNLYRHYRPLIFFTVVAILFVLLALIVGFPVVQEYILYDYVYRVPSAVLSASLMIFSLLTFITGIILDSVRHNSKELLNLRRKEDVHEAE